MQLCFQNPQGKSNRLRIHSSLLWSFVFKKWNTVVLRHNNTISEIKSKLKLLNANMKTYLWQFVSIFLKTSIQILHCLTKIASISKSKDIISSSEECHILQVDKGIPLGYVSRFMLWDTCWGLKWPHRARYLSEFLALWTFLRM